MPISPDISPNISHEQEYIQSNSQTSNESGEREPEGMSNDQTQSFKIKIPYNQKVEQGLRHELSIFTKDDNIEKHNSFDIPIPEFSLETILTGYNKITAQFI